MSNYGCSATSFWKNFGEYKIFQDINIFPSLTRSSLMVSRLYQLPCSFKPFSPQLEKPGWDRWLNCHVNQTRLPQRLLPSTVEGLRDLWHSDLWHCEITTSPSIFLQDSFFVMSFCSFTDVCELSGLNVRKSVFQDKKPFFSIIVKRVERD